MKYILPRPPKVRQYPGVKVVGGSKSVPALTVTARDGDTLEIGKNVKIKCMATPCHTQDSICYYVTDSSSPSQKGVFTGYETLLALSGH